MVSFPRTHWNTKSTIYNLHTQETILENCSFRAKKNTVCEWTLSWNGFFKMHLRIYAALCGHTHLPPTTTSLNCMFTEDTQPSNFSSFYSRVNREPPRWDRIWTHHPATFPLPHTHSSSFPTNPPDALIFSLLSQSPDCYTKQHTCSHFLHLIYLAPCSTFPHQPADT